MKNNLKVNLISLYIIILILGIVIGLLLKYLTSQETGILIIYLSYLGIFFYFLAIITWNKKTKKIFTPYLIFISICYLFMFGQCFLWALRIYLKYDLRMLFSDDQIIKAQFYTILGLSLFHLGAMVKATKSKSNKIKRKNQNNSLSIKDFYSCRIVGFVLLIVSIVPYLYFIRDQIKFSSFYGYKFLYYDPNFIRTGERASVIILSSLLTPAFISLLIGYCKTKIFYLLSIAIFIKNILDIYIGRRFEAYIWFLLLGIIWHYYRTKLNRKQIILFIIILFVVLTWTPAIRDYRHMTNKSIPEFLKYTTNYIGRGDKAIEAISEIGGSMYPLIMTMNLVPGEYQYRFGKSYLYSLITIIPNLGFWDIHIGYREANLGDWLMGVLNLGYGPGYSLIAEAYINFGWFGIIFLLLLGYLYAYVFLLLESDNARNNIILSCFVLTFFYFSITTIRNSFIANVRALFYYAIPTYFLAIYISNKINIKNGILKKKG
ncbi:MAG: O-antigen polysaccharide polymerase Wzy [Candidatus Aminicenantes bacterium]|nr:O-antigen polysaccharide polymerase Wzy [Candidatus Aminicenantes bacterium]